MSEFINNVSRRKEALKEVIQRLHAGETVESLKEKFGDAIRGATAGEIADAERAMIGEGIAVSEIQRLCDLHVAVFRETLDEEPAPESLPGHPVFTFRMENEVTMRLLESISDTLASWVTGDLAALTSLQAQTENLKTIEKHYSREENLLFPYLEKKGFEGPSTVMWGVHNEIRDQLRQFRQALADEEAEPQVVQSQFDALAESIREMIYKEEKILFPESLARLSDAEWAEIRSQEEEIGYFNGAPQPTALSQAENQEKSKQNQKENKTMDSNGLLSLDTGALTLEQINLMLTHLPVDVTYVDENDEVRYFTQGQHRIFDRSAAIIGRPVTKCHPPQSVHKVQIILDDFRSGKRDVAEFWIQMGEAFIHIRYFALRNKEGEYKGCIEVSQEISHLRSLEGEKRLLDDAPDYEK